MALKDRYLTVSEAAGKIGVTRQTISRWIRAGKIQSETIGRETLIDRDDLSLLYEEKMFDKFAETMSTWLRGAVIDYLQQHYLKKDFGLAVVASQSREHIKVIGTGLDGFRKIFDVPIGQLELVIDTKGKKLFHIKKTKVIVKPYKKELDKRELPKFPNP